MYVEAVHVGWGIFKINGKAYTVAYPGDHEDIIVPDGCECALVGFDNPDVIPAKEIVVDDETCWAKGFIL